MTSIDWHKLALNAGVLLEAVPESNRLVLWLPAEREHGCQFWQRIGSVPNADIRVEQGLCSIAATAIRARQRVGGLLRGLLRGFHRASDEQTWMLPNGGAAEQSSERQTDLILVWPLEEMDALDEARLRSIWPEGKQFQKIGKRLFLVAGVEPSSANQAAVTMPPPGNPREQAEHLLRAARTTGDRRGEAVALADLGVVTLSEGNAQRALAHLQQALALARQLEDRSVEADVLGNLGLAALSAGQRELTQQAYEQHLAYARASGDRYGEKLALQRLGHLYESRRDASHAVACFDEALRLTRAVGDQQQEGALLWHLAIQHAESGRRDQALALGQQAVDLLSRLKKPEADVFADQLQKYRLGTSEICLDGAVRANSTAARDWIYGGSIVATALADSTTTPAQEQPVSGPGLLRMALSAMHSMSKFLGSGLKTASAEMVHKRLRTCAACRHHTGVRCRICGCFTNLKARMDHERCPIAQWPV